MKPTPLGCINPHFPVASLLFAAVSGLCLVGCNGVTHMSPTILSPGPNAAVSSLPVTIQVRLNGGTLSQVKIELDGAVITSDFTESDGIATATINDGVYVGDNRLSATAVNLPPVLSTFSYAPPPPATLSAAAPPDSVPIQTQVQLRNGSGQVTNGVEVGQSLYANPGPATDWQLLLLSRTNPTSPSPLANKHYTLTPGEEGNYAAVDQLIADITPGGPLIQQCGAPGCLMVLQGPVNSGGFSPYPCGSTGTPTDATECSKLQSALTAIGATATSAFITGNIPSGAGYSFIGNVGRTALSAGVNFERITCSNVNGCLRLPVPTPADNNPEFMNGIAPNGVDGIIPTLAGTADNGTTSIPATPNAPTMNVYDNGEMSGLLVPDNYNNYTFTYAAPPIRYQMGPAPDNASKHIVILQLPAASPMKFPGGQTTLQMESATLPANQTGGFHLVILNATTFQPLANDTYVDNPNYCSGTCQSPDGTTIFSLDRLPERLQSLNSRGYLWFLGSFGNLSHNFAVDYQGQGYINMQDIWDRVAQSVQDLGGTYATFAMLDNPALAHDNWDQYTKDTVPTDDDYNMVGQLWINASGAPNPYAVETSKAISRQTTLYPVAGNMQGMLEKGHDGFYRVGQYSQYGGKGQDVLLSVPVLDFENASYLPRIPWPLTGTTDPPGPKNAYQWISEQLQGCESNTNSACGDIRSQYTNLNQVDWYPALSNLQPPADCNDANNPCGFSDQDFAAAKTQLLQEFYDLDHLHTVQQNMLTVKTTEEPNYAQLLTSVENNMLANIPYYTSLHTGADTTSDELNLVGAVGGFAGVIPVVGTPISSGIYTGIALYQLISDDGTTINDPNGVSLMQQEQVFTQAGKLANARANVYAESIATIGATFNRIVTDWGRMQTAAAPVIAGQVNFDLQTLGNVYLPAYNLATRRSLYAALMPLNYYAVHYRYAVPGLSNYQPAWFNYNPVTPYIPCIASQGLPNLLANNPQSYGFWQGALIDGPGASVQTSISGNGNQYPFDAWWDLWFIGQTQPYNDLISQNGSLEGTYPGCPTTDPATYLPSATFYSNTELFTRIGTDANALGLYKPWFLGRGSFSQLHAVGTSTAFWHTFINSGQPRTNGPNWALDPDNY